MKNLENIKAIIVPTCDYIENPTRARTAIEFVNKNNLPKKAIIAGLGPDTNLALGYDNNPDNHNIVFHKNMYDCLMNETDWMIGIDIRSLNSVENILEVFPDKIEGKYALVSYPLHLMRFKKIERDAKRAGKISENLEIVYVPTKQRLVWIPYEILSNLKYHLKGKKKYFGNSKTD